MVEITDSVSLESVYIKYSVDLPLNKKHFISKSYIECMFFYNDLIKQQEA